MITLRQMLDHAKNNPDDSRNEKLKEFITEGKFDKKALDEGIDLTGKSQTFKLSQEERTKSIENPRVDARLANNFNEKISTAGEALRGEGEFTGKSAVSRGFSASAEGASLISSTAYNLLPKGVRDVIDAGVDKLGQGFGKVIDSVAETDFIKSVAEADPNGEYTDQIEEVLGIARDAGIIAGEITGLKEGLSAASKVSTKVGNVVAPVVGKLDDAVQTGIKNVGDSIDSIKLPSVLGKNKQSVIDDAIKSGVKNLDADVAKTALARGFAPDDSTFLGSLSKNERIVGAKMQQLAEDALVNKRSIAAQRPVDLIGDNLINQYKPIQNLNKELGKGVDDAAKALKGQTVPTDDLINGFNNTLDDLGIVSDDLGKLTFDDSVFKRTPKIQKQVQNAFDDLAQLGDDPFKVHQFKKQIDEIVDCAKQGEGISGNGERLLKGLRTQADDLLDEAFPDYKAANDNFRITRELMNDADSLFGKKGLDTSKASNKLRAIFSNAQSRTSIKDFLSKLDDVAEQFGVSTGDNLTDQAILAQILEQQYGTQAITSLQGEVAKAVRGTQSVVEGLRNPIKGAGDLAANVIENVTGQTDEAQKAFLRDIFGGVKKPD